MKKLTLGILSLLVSVAIIAAPVDVKVAEKVAVNYYKHYAPTNIKNFEVKEMFSGTYNGMTTYYAFAFKAGGFVMVAADDASIPVLGSSHDSEFDNTNNPIAKAWFDAYSKEIADIVNAKLSNVETAKEWQSILKNKFAKGTKDVPNMLTTTWDQSPWYNQYCPSGSVTGCVATSMGQIMKYWNYPTTGYGSHSYIHTTYGVQTANFGATTYNWASMPNTVNSGNYQAVATLLYHCGVAVNMNYSPSGSGAFSEDVPAAMMAYFGYAPTMQYKDKANYPNNTDWFNLIKADLDAGRPVYYAGQDATQGGHAWVCCGYRSSDSKLYMNWGWSGYNNGYYAVGALNPTGYAFNQSNRVIIGIKPGYLGQTASLLEQASGFTAASRGIRCISAVDANTAWASAYDGSGGTAEIQEFTRTTNGGTTWTPGTIGGVSGYGISMIFGIDTNTAYAPAWGPSGGGKIQKTTNGGATWTTSHTFNASGFPNCVHFFDANNGWAMGDPIGSPIEFELYTTTNGGTNWALVPGANIPNPVAADEYGVVGFYDAVGDTVWFSTNKGRLFRSTNRGFNWEVFNTGIGNNQFELSFKNHLVGIIQSRPTSGAPVAKKTTDGGATWTALTPASGTFYTNSFAFVPNSDILISTGAATGASGISYSMNEGLNWYPYNAHPNTQFLACDFVNDTCGWIGAFNESATAGGMYKYQGIPTIVNFAADITSAGIGQNITFSNTTIGPANAYNWNFGANATPATAIGTGPHSVSYSAAGDKTIKLTVTRNGHDFYEQKTNYVNITAGITAYTLGFQVNNTASQPVSAAVITINDTANIYTNSSGFAAKTLAAGTYNYSVTAANHDTVTGSIVLSANHTEPVTLTNLNIKEQFASQFEMYPNPAKDVLHLTFAQDAKEVALIDALGNMVIKQNVNGNKKATLNLRDISSGVYFIKVISEKNTTTRKITIQ